MSFMICLESITRGQIGKDPRPSPHKIGKKCLELFESLIMAKIHNFNSDKFRE